MDTSDASFAVEEPSFIDAKFDYMNLYSSKVMKIMKARKILKDSKL